MALYTWSLYPPDLAEFLVDHGIDTAKANAAIRWASGTVNRILKKWDMLPSSITMDQQPEDFEYLRGVVTIGAGIYYKWTTTGTAAGTEFWQTQWTNETQALEKDPTRLETFSASEGGPVVQSHTTNANRSTVEDALNRMTDATNRRQWETI